MIMPLLALYISMILGTKLFKAGMIPNQNLALQVTSRERNPQFCGSPASLRERSFYQLNEQGQWLHDWMAYMSVCRIHRLMLDACPNIRIHIYCQSFHKRSFKKTRVKYYSSIAYWENLCKSVGSLGARLQGVESVSTPDSTQQQLSRWAPCGRWGAVMLHGKKETPWEILESVFWNIFGMGKLS